MTTLNFPNVALHIAVLDDRFAVCRLEPDSEVPDWTLKNEFFSITRTPDELSVVCPEPNIPDGVTHEDGWRTLKVEGPLDFSMVGVLASLLEPLADAGISVFTLSTYDTDYVLVQEDALEGALSTLATRYEVRDGNFVLHPARAEDEPFLWEMLYESVHWCPEKSGPKPPHEELLSEPVLRRHLEGWGRKGDFAVVALDVERGDKIGAVWYRTFSASEPGYGFVDESTPAIAIATVPEKRGMGVGGALLQTLIAAARYKGFEALSLGVQKSNLAAARLYEKRGFTVLRDEGEEQLMKLDLYVEETGEERITPRTERRCL